MLLYCDIQCSLITYYHICFFGQLIALLFISPQQTNLETQFILELGYLYDKVGLSILVNLIDSFCTLPVTGDNVKQSDVLRLTIICIVLVYTFYLSEVHLVYYDVILFDI